MMERGIILIVPAFEKNRGGGHITRCVSLVCDLRALGREAYLFLNAENIIPQNEGFNPEWRLTETKLKETGGKKTELVILDRFQTPCGELMRWKGMAPVIGVDEGGSCRDSFDFLIDILPSVKTGKHISPNISNPALLKLPMKPQSKDNTKIEKPKILVTFGHEDSAGLGIKIARTLCGCGNCEVALLRGAFSKDGDYSFIDRSDIKLMNTIPNLRRHLTEYDLVITHYGITAFEALYMGVPVILASPTKYHEKLAKNAGFPLWEEIIRKCTHKDSKGRKIIDTLRLCAFARDKCGSIAVKYGLDKEGESLAALVNGFSPQVNRRCPVCGVKAPDRSISRFTDRTYRKCAGCGVIFMDRTAPAPFEYGNEYFNESYKKQYGKTYLEDFDNIKKLGLRRLRIIKRLMQKTDKMTLLDIGCAYGPFMAAAKEAGFSPSGIDPSEDAVRYVQETLNIPAVQGFFPNCPLPTSFSFLPFPFSPLPANCSPPPSNYSSHAVDCATLWYVIEHFQNIETVFISVKCILAASGILAFSTPTFKGISGRSSLKKFLSDSPADHYTVWSPESSKKILAAAGFKVKKTVISGHHPERFPFIGKYAKNKKGLLYKILWVISKVFGLGDTFEVYAQKK